jgi:hypothetical protein
MKVSELVGSLGIGQDQVYIPPLAGTFTGLPRLVMCFHGAGSSASGETYLGKQNYMLRAQAFAKAGLAQLWFDGGFPGVKLTAASAVSATSLTVSANVTNGVYILDPRNGATTETITVSGAGGGTTTPTITAATKAHLSGAILISASASGWGSAADIAMADAAWAYAQANLSVKTDKVLTYGNSAGNPWALQWALHSSAVLAHAGSLPVVDIQNIRDNNWQSLASQVESSYSGNGTTGVAPSSAWYQTVSPILNEAALSAIPQKFWYSDADPVALPSLSASYATAVGASTVDMGSGGHTISTPAPYGCLPYADVATWLVSQA